MRQHSLRAFFGCKRMAARESTLQAHSASCDKRSFVFQVRDKQETFHNGLRTPFTGIKKAPSEDDEADDIHPASALLFLKSSKSSEPPNQHRRAQAASR